MRFKRRSVDFVKSELRESSVSGDLLSIHTGGRTRDQEVSRNRKSEPTEEGDVVSLPMVGGLYHRYARRAA
jgi:hypothetical protein